MGDKEYMTRQNKTFCGQIYHYITARALNKDNLRPLTQKISIQKNYPNLF